MKNDDFPLVNVQYKKNELRFIHNVRENIFIYAIADCMPNEENTYPS